MKRTWTTLTMLLCALSPGAPLAAQEPSAERMRAAEEMLAVMDMEATMHETMNLLIEQEIAANPGLEQARDIMVDFLGRATAWSAIAPEVVAIYAELFTVDELRDLRAFYTTPTGRNLLRATPEISTRMNTITQARMTALLPEMEKALIERMTGKPGS